MAILYVVAQFTGAFMGYGLLIILTPTTVLQSSGPSFCTTKPMELVTSPQALCIEFLATGTLIWFCCGIWDPRNQKHQDSVPLRFALAIAGLVSASVRFMPNIVFVVLQFSLCIHWIGFHFFQANFTGGSTCRSSTYMRDHFIIVFILTKFVKLFNRPESSALHGTSPMDWRFWIALGKYNLHF